MEVAMKLTEIAHFTPDVTGMAAFYRVLLNAAPVVESEEMAIFMNGDVKIFIHRTYDADEGDLPPENHHAYTVANVDEACERLLEAGLKIETPAKDYYWGRSSYLRDPDGNLIEIIQAE